MIMHIPLHVHGEFLDSGTFRLELSVSYPDGVEDVFMVDLDHKPSTEEINAFVQDWRKELNKSL